MRTGIHNPLFKTILILRYHKPFARPL